MTVLIVADPGDHGADALADDLAGRAVRVVAADLSRPGWTYRPDVAGRTGATAAGLFNAGNLTHAIIRPAAVFDTHLPHVIAADRAYVAAELTAFLRAWLTDLPCPMANRPSAQDLAGPGYPDEGWTAAACRAGVACVPVRRAVPGPLPRVAALAQTRVAVAGPHVEVDGPGDPALADRALAVLATAGVTLATVGFDGEGQLTDVDVRPELSGPAIRRVLGRWLA